MSDSAFIKQLPNLLTYLRLVLIPVFVVLLLEPSDAMVIGAVAVFVVAALTDYIDGIIARRFGAVSDIGKLLDPMADKILVMAGLVMLLGQHDQSCNNSWVPSWMVVLVLSREIWVTGIRGVAAASGIVVAAAGAGKIKSGLQMVSIVLLLLHDRSLKSFYVPIDRTCQQIGTLLLGLSIFFSIWGAISYTWQVLRATSKSISSR